ncbi:MAG TPA: DUF4147 domain-containing protein [Gemmatirosa sp.]
MTRSTLERWYAAAVAGAHPGPAVAAAIASYQLPAPPGGVHLLAVGKAAHEMARAAVAALAARGVAPAGGLVVAHHPAPPPAPGVDVAVGDHPIPGAASLRAAAALGVAAARIGPADLGVVLVSGGMSSLVASPIDARLAADDLAATSRALLAAGVPIDVVNAVRKRVSRWGAGRLARALAPARVLSLVVSDVAGDDPAVIGSGPCAPDPWTAAALRDALAPTGVWSALPPRVRLFLDGDAVETPKAGDPAFARVDVQIVRTNADARAAAADAARASGYAMVIHDGWLAGEAAPLGRALTQALTGTLVGTLVAADVSEGARGIAHVWGGEPTVTLGPTPHTRGGRMQELALAAAAALHEAGSRARGIGVLAAGTDGRDGPTDAAGAVVDATTWAAVRARGRDPAADLAAHRSYDALDAAGALLPAAPSGTNVADVVLALRAWETG